MSKPIKAFNIKEFLSKLIKIKDTDCQVYPFSHTANGYGRVFIHPDMIYAHRIAWEIENGEIPEGLHVLHHCDNPPCCNPEHLFLGTPKDNAIDKAQKGRARNGLIKGETHTLSKLTEDDIKKIKMTYKRGIPGKASQYSIKGLAVKYGVASSLIHRIIKGVSWPHIEVP